MIEQPAVLVAELLIVHVVHRADQSGVGLYLHSIAGAISRLGGRRLHQTLSTRTNIKL